MPWASCPKWENGTTVPECEKSSETAYFWYRTTLDISPTMDTTGGVKWWIVLCLLLAWVTVFFIVMKGIQSSGKVSVCCLLNSVIAPPSTFLLPTTFFYTTGGIMWWIVLFLQLAYLGHRLLPELRQGEFVACLLLYSFAQSREVF